MKVSKEYNEKRNEILDSSERLFTVYGYDKCTIKNILDDVGIAKGTFYYYFKSKEELLDSIIDRVIEMVVEKVQEIAINQELSPAEKLIYAILSMKVESEIDNEFMDRLHKPENALIHQKSLTLMVRRITPILDKIVKEGIKERVFKTEFPTQYIQIFLTSSMTLLDDGIFKASAEEQQILTRALVALLEKMLGVKDRTFWNIVKNNYT